MKYNFNGFTENGNNAINFAIETAESFGHTYVGSEHLLIGLLKMIGTTLEIIIILILIILTGYLSMAELAVVSIRKAKMQKYLDKETKTLLQNRKNGGIILALKGRV